MCKETLQALRETATAIGMPEEKNLKVLIEHFNEEQRDYIKNTCGGKCQTGKQCGVMKMLEANKAG